MRAGGRRASASRLLPIGRREGGATESVSVSPRGERRGGRLGSSVGQLLARKGGRGDGDWWALFSGGQWREPEGAGLPEASGAVEEAGG